MKKQLHLHAKKDAHKDWITTETLEKIDEKKKAALNNSRTRSEKIRAQPAYTEAKKMV